MNSQQEREQRLWEYIDGIAPAEERTVIEQLLQTDAAWKAAYTELLEVNRLLHASELDAPSLRFTKNVMEEVARLSVATTKKYLNNRIIWGIGLFFITMLIGALVFAVGQAGSSSNRGSNDNFSITDKINSLNLNRLFSNTWINVLIMINVVLGLFLLDSYLTRKRNQYRKEA